MNTLPNKITTTMLQSFWIMLCITSVVSITLILWILVNSILSLYLLLLIPLLVIPGIVKPDFIAGFYTLFNRVLRRLNREIRYLILLITHYIFLLPLKFSGADQLNLNPPSKESTWTVKSLMNHFGEPEGYGVYTDISYGSGRIWPFVNRVIRDKKWWLLSAIPFILIISLVSERKVEKTVAHDTYTLY